MDLNNSNQIKIKLELLKTLSNSIAHQENFNDNLNLLLEIYLKEELQQGFSSVSATSLLLLLLIAKKYREVWKIYVMNTELTKILSIAKKLANNDFKDYYSSIKFLFGSNSIENQILVKCFLKVYEIHQAQFFRDNFYSMSLATFKVYLGEYYQQIELDKYLAENNFILKNNFIHTNKKIVNFYNQEEGKIICLQVNRNIKNFEKLANFRYIKTMLDSANNITSIH